MFVPNTGFSSKTRKIGRKTKPTQGGRSGAWTGCPRRLSSFRACPHPTGSSRLIDSAGSDLAGTARTECAQSLSSVLLTSARQGLDHKEGKYLGFKRKVKRYSDKLTSDKIIFLNYRQTFYQNTRKTCRRRRILPIFYKFPVRRHLSMRFNWESVTLLLQVLWISVSINVRQNRQQHCNGEDSYSNTDNYSNKEKTECFFRFSHTDREQILLMNFLFRIGNVAKSS